MLQPGGKQKLGTHYVQFAISENTIFRWIESYLVVNLREISPFFQVLLDWPPCNAGVWQMWISAIETFFFVTTYNLRTAAKIIHLCLGFTSDQIRMLHDFFFLQKV